MFYTSCALCGDNITIYDSYYKVHKVRNLYVEDYHIEKDMLFPKKICEECIKKFKFIDIG